MFAWIFGSIFMSVGLLELWLASRAFARDRAIARWPRVPGKIIASRVDTRTGRSRDSRGYEREYTSHQLVVQYTYTVDGVEYQGDRLARETYSSSTKPDLDRYRPGQEVEVLHDPTDPKTAYLEQHFSVGALILAIKGAVFAAIGLIVPLLVTFA